MTSEQRSPGWFDSGRIWPFPAIYPEWKTPVTYDVLLMGWVAAFFALFLPFMFVVPASNNKTSRLLRVTVMLLIGLFIMLCNFGQEWEVGKIRTRTQYRAGTADDIEADIGVKMGLRSVNITLKGKPDENSSLAGETIDYNERFSWTWAQGRPGFGPYAGQIQRDYRAAQHRGAPYPILWIAEYFTFDGEGIRFGRYYRTSGWYSHIFIWAAFPMWVMTVALFKLVVRYAALALSVTGTMMVIPNCIWAANRNPIELQIPFESGILKTQFGWCFYLSLFTGIFCIVTGAVLYFLSDPDKDLYNDELSEFFGCNPWRNPDLFDEENNPEEEEEPQPTSTSNDIEMESLNPQPKELKRTVTMREKGASSRHRGKRFQVPRNTESTSSQNTLRTASSSSPPQIVYSGPDGSDQQSAARQRLASGTINSSMTIEDETERASTSAISGATRQKSHHHSPALSLHDIVDEKEPDDSVFEIPTTKLLESPNLSPNRKEF